MEQPQIRILVRNEDRSVLCDAARLLDLLTIAVCDAINDRDCLTRERVGPCRQKVLALKIGRPWIPSGFVFQIDDTSEFLTPDRAAHAHRAFIAKHGLPVHRFHDLRHTCATLLLKHGENVQVVAKQLGNASPTITLTIYSHVLPDQRKGVAARMSKLLAG